MNTPEIRKIVTRVEETHREAGVDLPAPTRKAAVAAVIANPFAGRHEEDLELLFAIGEQLGEQLGTRAVEALGIDPGQVESYGKAVLVGTDGELEHAAAILHPRLGKGLRAATGGGRALIASSKKVGGPGQVLDVPLGHKDAAYVRSHFDAIEIWVNDAPRRAELLVAVAVTDSGRPLPRVGGLTVDGIEGTDGLR
ncbi:amino acid synthesis family protein [Nitriliruptor alkaliphilus]|uniref:amino acid synthesis family protein n=1 Tax=Nitriliruptor alkaliphilus TaxID=427918 RepID=UPI000696B21E|nr:amino acid synthesis family protein [Nitriliruptor alkaliphilus]